MKKQSLLKNWVLFLSDKYSEMYYQAVINEYKK